VAGNATFLRSDTTLAWLGQFAPEDQSAAVDLLRAMALVSRDQFAACLRATVLHQVESGETPVGLYVERELRHRKGVPHRLFKQTTGKVKRAYGAGPPLVQPTKAYDPNVGSEGLVAQYVSELCRQYPKKYTTSPGRIRFANMRSAASSSLLTISALAIVLGGTLKQLGAFAQ
jgi:hypothetical protein